MPKKYLLCFLISMVPLIELRGAVPYGVLMGLDYPVTLAVCIVGNMLPVPLIYFFARKGVWLQIVEASYEMSPVIYTTEEYYDQLHEILPQYDIWIRSVYSEPRSGISWSIWQYSNRMRLNGYSGSEKYIDMNVYNGTLEDFENYGK